nr:serine/arginine repetitive matrix protein 1-like [Aegilops tauschii subsp. strangulata]
MATRYARAEEGRLSLLEIPKADPEHNKAKAKDVNRKGPVVLAAEPEMKHGCDHPNSSKGSRPLCVFHNCYRRLPPCGPTKPISSPPEPIWARARRHPRARSPGLAGLRRPHRRSSPPPRRMPLLLPSAASMPQHARRPAVQRARASARRRASPHRRAPAPHRLRRALAPPPLSAAAHRSTGTSLSPPGEIRRSPIPSRRPLTARAPRVGRIPSGPVGGSPAPAQHAPRPSRSASSVLGLAHGEPPTFPRSCDV